MAVLSSSPTKHPPPEKIKNKKGVERERREQTREQRTAEARREAAFNASMDEEFCRELVGKFARESNKRTGNAIGGIRDRYETIVTEFRTVRYTQPNGKRCSLATVLRGDYETHQKLKEFLAFLGLLIASYEASNLQAVEKLRGHALSKNMMTVLALEYVRDRNCLMSFLKAIFKHWRKIFADHSPWLRKLITHQHATDVPHHQIAQNLEKVGAVSKGSADPTTKYYASLRAKIKQDRSRDPKAAIRKRERSKL